VAFFVKGQLLATGLWFSLGTSISSTNKTDRHDITFNIVESGVKHNKPNLSHKQKKLILDPRWLPL
jgi:hypothetical protein